MEELNMDISLLKRIKIKHCDLLLIYPINRIRNSFSKIYKREPVIIGLKFDERKNNVPIVKTIFKHTRKSLDKLIAYAEKYDIQVKFVNYFYNKSDYYKNKKIPTCRYKEIAEIYSKQAGTTTYDFISKFTKNEKLLKIQIGYALIPLVEKGSKYDYLSNFCCKIRDKIFCNTGIILPYFVICDNPELKAMEFEFIINGEIILHHDFLGIQLVEIGMYIREFVEIEINKRLKDIVNPKWLIEYMDNYDNEKLLSECLFKKHIPAEFVLDVIHKYINQNKKVDLKLIFDTISNNYERSKNVDEIISIINWIQNSESLPTKNQNLKYL